MRVKRQKRHRRCVRFYTTCFGFRDPFKVFCDGTFIHHLLVNQITSASDALSNLLGAPTKLFTTRCVIAELKSLGDSYSKSFHEACNLSTARCDHEKRKSAVRCIEDVIGGNNPEHFFVATQDTELRKKLEEALPYSHTAALLSCMDLKNKGLNQGKERFRMPQDFEIPGVPLIYGLRKSLLLEPPSAFQRQFVKSSEEGRLHLSELELKMLQKKGTSTLASQVTTDSSDTHEGLEDQVLMPEAVRKTNARRTLSVRDKPTFKRKKPKGPNPLSVKKKKTNVNPSHPPKKDDGEHASGKKNRKRKRSRKGSSKIGGEAD